MFLSENSQREYQSEIDLEIHQMICDLRRIVVSALLCFCALQLPLPGQLTTADSNQYSELVDQSFGQDQELVNGVQFHNKHPRSMGHPYLLEDVLHQGSVTIRGQHYIDIWLKYDIYARQVEVAYKTISGATNHVVLVSDHVDEFTLGNRYFRKMILEEEQQEQFYQVIGDGTMVWYIRWEKRLVPVSGNSNFIEEFSKAKRQYLMELGGSVYPFHNKKSFLKLLPKAVHKDMKRLIKTNQLQIRSASAEQLKLFVLAAAQLVTGGVEE
jgi:hypothetical protein